MSRINPEIITPPVYNRASHRHKQIINFDFDPVRLDELATPGVIKVSEGIRGSTQGCASLTHGSAY